MRIKTITLLAGMVMTSLNTGVSIARMGLSSPAPTSAPSSVTWEKKGVKLGYPSTWHPKQSPDFELMLLPEGSTTGDRTITFDIPDLPPHLPFMIQMGQVQKEYLADLKKAHPDLHIDEASDANVPGATAKLVRSTWHRDKQAFHDVVLLIIHSSGVYILDAQGDDAHQPDTRAAFDSIRASLQWVKQR
jgi:hypothetical protein